MAARYPSTSASLENYADELLRGVIRWPSRDQLGRLVRHAHREEICADRFCGRYPYTRRCRSRYGGGTCGF
eukprot:7141862-Pyramimonas_sp.AAC.1